MKSNSVTSAGAGSFFPIATFGKPAAVKATVFFLAAAGVGAIHWFIQPMTKWSLLFSGSLIIAALALQRFASPKKMAIAPRDSKTESPPTDLTKEFKALEEKLRVHRANIKRMEADIAELRAKEQAWLLAEEGLPSLLLATADFELEAITQERLALAETISTLEPQLKSMQAAHEESLKNDESLQEQRKKIDELQKHCNLVLEFSATERKLEDIDAPLFDDLTASGASAPCLDEITKTMESSLGAYKEKQKEELSARLKEIEKALSPYPNLSLSQLRQELECLEKALKIAIKQKENPKQPLLKEQLHQAVTAHEALLQKIEQKKVCQVKLAAKQERIRLTARISTLEKELEFLNGSIEKIQREATESKNRQSSCFF